MGDLKMSRSSRGSIYSTKSISDVEKYEEEYNDALKKLKMDKASLKDKLRRIVSQYEEVLKQHKMEIQKYDYKFDLEKDKQKNFYEQEKHDIVREYEEKINILKDTLEKKYDLRQTQLISRYEANIKSLSQRLEKETFDKEKEREKIIYHINDKETEFTAKLGNMEEQYKKILEGHVNEKNNIRKILTERTTELNELKISIDEEKKKTIAERELYQKNVQTIKDSYEQKRKTDEKKLEELRILVQAEKDINKAEYVRNIEEIVNTSNKKIVEIKQHYENKISDSERLFEIKIKNIEDEYRRNIETISYQHNQKINFLTIEVFLLFSIIFQSTLSYERCKVFLSPEGGSNVVLIPLCKISTGNSLKGLSDKISLKFLLQLSSRPKIMDSRIGIKLTPK